MKSAAPDSMHRVSAVDIARPAFGELRHALDELLTGSMPRRSIVHLESRPLPYASSFAIEELDVRFDDGSCVELVWKDMSSAAMLPEARRIKPRFLFNPLREIAIYQSILTPLGISAPRFYGSVIDQPRRRYWLFLERVNGRPLTEVGDFERWRQVSAWLARMHGSVPPASALACVAASVPLVQYDGTASRRWTERARRHVLDGDGEPRSRRLRFARLASRYQAVVEELAALPTGFVHGEFFPSNVMVEAAAGAAAVRPLDWEVAGIGPLLVDLAALTAGAWTDDERTELAKSYHAALDPQSHAWHPRENFMRALECCRLEIAVRQLGWAKQRTPPAPHMHDWLGEALEAADRIGL